MGWNCAEYTNGGLIPYIASSPKKQEVERNWSFTTSSPHTLAMEEIYKYLSRENPVIFFRVKSERSMGAVHVFLHHTLIKKACHVNLICPFEYSQLTKEVMMVTNLEVPESVVVKWAKKVKNKQWGVHGIATKVIVGIPKI